MTYIRKAVAPIFDKGSDSDVLATWVGEELEAIEKSVLDDIIALELRPTGQTPSRPREGMIIYADGSNYNPGFGEGPYVYKNGLWVPLTGRRVVAAAPNLHVETTGNDSTGDGSVSAPFLTIQHAIDVMAGSFDLATFGGTISVGNGTYNVTTGQPAMTLLNYVGKGPIGIVGNTGSPGSVVVNVTGNDVIAATNVLGQYNIAGFQLKPGTGFNTLRASGGSTFVQLQDIWFDVAAIAMSSGYNAQIFLVGSGKILAGTYAAFWSATLGGIVQSNSITITLTGTPAFNAGFAICDLGGKVNVPAITFSGGATGKKFAQSTGGIIATQGAGINYLPGNAAGTADPGGYV